MVTALKNSGNICFVVIHFAGVLPCIHRSFWPISRSQADCKWCWHLPECPTPMLALLCALASHQLVLTRTLVFPCWPQAAGSCQCNSSWKWSCGLLVLGSRAKMDAAELLEVDACSTPLERDKGKYVVIPTKHSENLEQCMHQTGSYWSMTLVFHPVSTSCPWDPGPASLETWWPYLNWP